MYQTQTVIDRAKAALKRITSEQINLITLAIQLEDQSYRPIAHWDEMCTAAGKLSEAIECLENVATSIP